MDKHKQEVETYFSEQTEYWRIVYDENRPRSMPKLEMINRRRYIYDLIEKYRDNRQICLLDAGSGSGGILYDLLVDKDIHPVSLDISMDMCKETKKLFQESRIEHTRSVQADIEFLPFSADSFDMVLCVGILQYLQRDTRAIRELSRVLKNNGVLLVTTPNILRVQNFLDPYYYFSFVRLIFKKMIKNLNVHRQKSESKDFHKNTDFSNRKYFYWQLNTLFTRNNLVRLETKTIGYGPVTVFRKPLLHYHINKKISDFGEGMANSKNNYFRPLKIFGNRWIFCLRKMG